MARDLDAVFESALAHQRAHVEVAVRVADERVAEVVPVAQVRERAQGALDAFVRRDESERGETDRAGGRARVRRRNTGVRFVLFGGIARGGRGGLGRDVVVDAAHGDAGRDCFEAGAAPVGVDDDALGRACEAAVEREVERAGEDRGRGPARERLFGLAPRLGAVAGGHLVEVQTHVAALAREPEEEVLEREVVEDDHAGVRAHRVEDARVVAVVVADVIDDRVELAQRRERRRIAPVVAHVEARGQPLVRGAEPLDEERHLGARRRQVRQKLLAVVGDPRTLRAEGAEVG